MPLGFPFVNTRFIVLLGFFWKVLQNLAITFLGADRVSVVLLPTMLGLDV
jgi:hypothetical protein